jgi:hypothetical protein
MIPETTAVDSFTVDDGDHRVELRKLLTPNGERLVVESDGASVRLDALALESLTWQDAAFFEDLTGSEHAGDEGVPVDDEPTIQIGNEYTTIRIRSHETTDGPRISLRSPKLEYHCLLDAAELAAIAHRDAAFFSDLLETPLGPEDDHTHIL